MTPTQKRVLDAIKILTRQLGMCPSYMQLSQRTGHRSLATLTKHIRALEAKGYIVRIVGHSRSITVVPDMHRGDAKWNVCEQGHPLILYHVALCPLCSIGSQLAEIRRAADKKT